METATTPIPPPERLIFALDVPNAADARELVSTLGDSVSFYKLGLELFMSDGYFPLLRDLLADGKVEDYPDTKRRMVVCRESRTRKTSDGIEIMPAKTFVRKLWENDILQSDMDSIVARLGVPDYEFRLVLGSTKIDYDSDKEKSNRKKHGYSLESAACLLERILLPFSTGNKTPHLVSDPFKEGNEIRHMHMSVDDNGHIVIMVTTMRPSETVRVISFRRANKKERETFRQNTGYVET